MSRSPHPLLRGLWRRGGAVGRWSRAMDRATAGLLELERAGSPPALEPPDALLEPLLRGVDLGALAALTGMVDAGAAGEDGTADRPGGPGRRPFIGRPGPGDDPDHAPTPPRPGDGSPASRALRPPPSAGGSEGARLRHPDRVPAAEATRRLPDPPRGAGSWTDRPQGRTLPDADPESAAPRRRPRRISAQEAREALHRRAAGTGALDRLVMPARDGAAPEEDRTSRGRPAGPAPETDDRRPAAPSPRAAPTALPKGATGAGAPAHVGSLPAPPAPPPGDAGRDTLSRLGQVVARLERRARSAGHRGGSTGRHPDAAAADPRATAHLREARAGGARRGAPVAPARSGGAGLTGLRGLAARAADVGPDRPRTDPPAHRPTPPSPGLADETELEERIGAILRREARSQGIDLDGVGP